jgi:hypothetical protein
MKCEMFEQIINDFCRRITPDFEQLRTQLKIVLPHASPQALAQNLMEFGRGQISQVDEADEQEKHFVITTIKSLSFDHVHAAQFHAYSSGCLMGLVSKKELPGNLIGLAMEITAFCAFQRYAPEALQGGVRPNALLTFHGETAWEKLKRQHETIPWEIK